LRLGAFVAIALLLAASAGAEVVETWTETSLQFANLGGAEVSTSSTGLATLHTSSTSSSHLATITLPILSLQAQTSASDPNDALFTGAVVSLHQRPDLQGDGVIGNVSGAIGGSGALTPGTLPATGGFILCVLVSPLPPCAAQRELTLGATDSSQWIGAGVGGILALGSTSGFAYSVVGAPFTVGTVTVSASTDEGGLTFLTARGFAHGPLSATSSTA
jgi:hypothetical protein